MNTPYAHVHNHRPNPVAPPMGTPADYGAVSGPGPAVLRMPRNTHISDDDFLAMMAAFRHSGGLLGGDELALRLQAQRGCGYAELARWIVGRKVFSFAWNHDFWLPAFQFDLRDMSIKPGIEPLMAELGDVMDGLSIGQWFVERNSELQGQSPHEAMDQRWPAVFQAARLQRFVLKA